MNHKSLLLFVLFFVAITLRSQTIVGPQLGLSHYKGIQTTPLLGFALASNGLLFEDKTGSQMTLQYHFPYKVPGDPIMIRPKDLSNPGFSFINTKNNVSILNLSLDYRLYLGPGFEFDHGGLYGYAGTSLEFGFIRNIPGDFDRTKYELASLPHKRKIIFLFGFPVGLGYDYFIKEDRALTLQIWYTYNPVDGQIFTDDFFIPHLLSLSIGYIFSVRNNDALLPLFQSIG